LVLPSLPFFLIPAAQSSILHRFSAKVDGWGATNPPLIIFNSIVATVDVLFEMYQFLICIVLMGFVVLEFEIWGLGLYIIFLICIVLMGFVALEFGHIYNQTKTISS
jgi:hypothetical protein